MTPEMSKRERILYDALEKISKPIAFLQNEAEREGSRLNGTFAIQLADNANWLSDIATKAIAQYTALSGEQIGRPKIICLCGSTRFAEYFMIKRWELEKQGIITFGINILPDNYFAEGNSHGAEQDGVKDILDELHKRKIDLANEIFVLNVGGYIGESTRSEIDYATAHGKPVRYLEPPIPNDNDKKQ